MPSTVQDKTSQAKDAENQTLDVLAKQPIKSERPSQIDPNDLPPYQAAVKKREELAKQLEEISTQMQELQKEYAQLAQQYNKATGGVETLLQYFEHKYGLHDAKSINVATGVIIYND